MKHVRPTIVPMSLPYIWDSAIKQFPERCAVDFMDRRYTYARLGNLVDRATRGFQQLGVRKGTCVGLCLPNTPYAVICYFAILKAGGIVVNYNPLYVERELKHQIEDSGTTIMVTLDLAQIYPKVVTMLEDMCLERIVVCRMAECLPRSKAILFSLLKRSELADIHADLQNILFAQLISNDGKPSHVDIDPLTDVAVLQYTGGTTGVPKGAMLTHGNLTANVEQCRRILLEDSQGGERILGVLPLFHVFAMTIVMNLGVTVGAELILMPRFEIKQVLRTIVRKKPTLFPGVPTIFTAINNAANDGAFDLSSIHYCISGGAPLPGDVRCRFEQLSGCRLIEGYGLSEASPVVICNTLKGENKPESIGVPATDTIIEVRDPENPSRVLGVGERGEICVSGPQVMAGYWRRPTETAEVMVDGMLRTGDIGYRDEEGHYFIVDRIKDLILCGGYNVYPRVIEEALYRHQAVAEAVVIGIPDVYRGQAPKAFVRLREGISVSPEQIKTFLEEQISRIEMPKIIEIRDHLPKTMIGKLSKKELIEEERIKMSVPAQDRAMS
ncbi:long-chain-fatty-acid--CoA ligase [Beijerinckia mobilis]|uniref:long-chain-fatty-acid--CoA ligase n=1 Tax=Beijerinckia mobilis TaxID=231434 RepID=UPI000556020B|nr:long-chain fatty acid--CoA ligase [Beijerinckia mobilis]